MGEADHLWMRPMPNLMVGEGEIAEKWRRRVGEGERDGRGLAEGRGSFQLNGEEGDRMAQSNRNGANGGPLQACPTDHPAPLHSLSPSEGVAAARFTYMVPEQYPELVKKFVGPVSDEEVKRVPKIGNSPTMLSVKVGGGGRV